MISAGMRRTGVVGVAAVALLLAGGLTAQAADGQTAMTGDPVAPGVTVDVGPQPVVPDSSVSEAPEQVASDVSPGEAAKISVASVNPDGKLIVTTTPVVGPDQAADVVAGAQSAPATVAVGVAAPVTMSALPSVDPAAIGDPSRPLQWALDQLRAEAAWSLSTGAGQVVAVVDTGVQADHPDLVGKVLPGAEFISNPGLGCPAGSAADCQGHGTHVAGIVAATTGNGRGIASLGRAAKILPVRVMGTDGSGSTATVAQGIIWAADHGATVINLSCAATSDDATMHAAVQYAVGKGIPVVAAAGNLREDGNKITYPGSYPEAMAVSATTKTRAIAAYSNSGSYVDVAAPGGSASSAAGENILSTARGGGYRELAGTSMATPYVSATMALLRAIAPTATPDQLQQLVQRTATDLGVKGRDNDFGAGLIDPVAALQQISVLPVSYPVLTATALATSFPARGQARVSWAVPKATGGSPVGRYWSRLSAPNSTVSFGRWVATSGPSRTLTGLVVGARYRLQIKAENRVGASWPVSMGFRQATPPSAVPRMAVISAPAVGAATVGWFKPTSNGGSPIIGYFVRISEPGSTTRFRPPVVVATNSHVFTGLRKGSRYRVDVVAFNSQGGSRVSSLNLVAPK